jgi:hypothetical protein
MSKNLPRKPSALLSVDAAERISAGCYGALVAASTLVATRDTSLADLVLIVVLTNVIYYATHVFAYTIGDHSPEATNPLKTVRHHLKVSAPLVSAAFAPVLVVLLLALFGVGLEAATVGGVITAVLFLASVAMVGAILRRFHPLSIVAIAVVTIIVSLALVIAKISLH